MSVQAKMPASRSPDSRSQDPRTGRLSYLADHAHTARLLDPIVDLMLVGDSLGMVMHGMETRSAVSLDLMIPSREGRDARLVAGPCWS